MSPALDELRTKAKRLQNEIMYLESRLAAVRATEPDSPPAVLPHQIQPAAPWDMGEAVMLGEIKGMLQSAPTEALADLLARMRGTSREAIMDGAAAAVAARSAPPSRMLFSGKP